MKQYTLGFIFDHTLEKILLVHKLSPEWQKGKLNGIGGKIEIGETSFECIQRETLEESNLKINKENWIYLGCLKGTQWTMDVFMTRYEGDLKDAKKVDKEEVEWFDRNQLPINILSNLNWLIPFARDKINDHNLQQFTVEYS